MAVYNGLPYLPHALNSILGQTLSDFEFVIVNDCSTDRTADVIRGIGDPRIRLIENRENLNQTRSLNRGLEEVRTPFVARMDADDLSHPRRLDLQMDFLYRHPTAAVVGSNTRWINESGELIGNWDRPMRDVGLKWAQLHSCQVAGGSVLFRTAVIRDRLGGYDSSFRFSQDWELWSRVHGLGLELANVSEYLLDVRTHANACSLVHQETARAEDDQIRRMYRERVLGPSDGAPDWFERIQELISRRQDDPKNRLDLLNLLHDRFCDRYPAARSDAEVRREVSKQYFQVLSHTDFQHWATSRDTLARALRHTRSDRFIYEAVRWAVSRSLDRTVRKVFR